ncbi:MAG: hypothetical protein AAGJ81_05920 [Verrucomicrobiota bacterium]
MKFEVQKKVFFALSLLLINGWRCATSAQPLVESDPEVRVEVGDFFGPGATGAYRAENAMVSTASVQATLAGLEILHQGRNAFDAAVLVQLPLTPVDDMGVYQERGSARLINLCKDPHHLH